MININQLKKSYGKNNVLKDISFELNTGEVTAIVGPNGSGKTTLIKSILGLVKFKEGTIKVNGLNVQDDFTYKNFIGYVPQIARYPENLTGYEILSLIKELRNSSEYFPDILITLFRLKSELNKPFKNLSGGTKQKLSILIAFAFNPKILILDEPTAGLDPVSSSYFKELIIEEKKRNKTIILTSHIMSEIQELADELVFLLDGEIKFKGTISSLLQKSNETKLERVIAQLMEGN